MKPFTKYRVLWGLSHRNGGVQQLQLSPIILARNLAECLRKAELKKNSCFLNCYIQPWYSIHAVTVYQVGSQQAFCYSDGFWRKFWTISLDLEKDF